MWNCEIHFHTEVTELEDRFAREIDYLTLRNVEFMLINLFTVGQRHKSLQMLSSRLEE